jgi:hypothetical protein
MIIDYSNRIFRCAQNTAEGDVGNDTVFHYRQEGDVVWATYAGGPVAFGTLIGRKLVDGRLDARYQHVTIAGTVKAGRCWSTPEALPGGRIRLHEEWTWTEGGTGSGSSQVEEIATATS